HDRRREPDDPADGGRSLPAAAQGRRAPDARARPTAAEAGLTPRPTGSPLPEATRADGARQAPGGSARPTTAGHRADAPPTGRPLPEARARRTRPAASDSARPTADTRRTTLPTGAPRGRRGRPGHDRQPASETPADGSPLPETARAGGTRQAPSDSARPTTAGHRADAPADDERPAGGGAGRAEHDKHRAAAPGRRRRPPGRRPGRRRAPPGTARAGRARTRVAGQPVDGPVADASERAAGPSGAQGAQEQVREVVGDLLRAERAVGPVPGRQVVHGAEVVVDHEVGRCGAGEDAGLLALLDQRAEAFVVAAAGGAHLLVLLRAQ